MSGHALSVIQHIKLENYDGIISIGGDGMFAEVFNGVTIRTAKDADIDIDDKNVSFVKPQIPVGFIPAGKDSNVPMLIKHKAFVSGSTDCISMSLTGSADPVTAALHIVLGNQMQVDIISIHSERRLERFAMSMLSYGYFGDLLSHSEKYYVELYNVFLFCHQGIDV